MTTRKFAALSRLTRRHCPIFSGWVARACMGRCLLADGSERNSKWGYDLGRRRLCGTPVLVAKSDFLPRSADLQFIDSSAHPAVTEGFVFFVSQRTDMSVTISIPGQNLHIIDDGGRDFQPGSTGHREFTNTCTPEP